MDSPHVQRIKEKVNASLEDLDQKLKVYPVANQLEEQVGVKFAAVYGAVAAAVLFVLFLFVGFGAGLLVNLVAFAYPAHASMRAVGDSRSSEYKQWLSYWCIYTALTLFESVFEGIMLYLTP